METKHSAEQRIKSHSVSSWTPWWSLLVLLTFVKNIYFYNSLFSFSLLIFLGRPSKQCSVCPGDTPRVLSQLDRQFFVQEGDAPWIQCPGVIIITNVYVRGIGMRFWRLNVPQLLSYYQSLNFCLLRIV